MGVGLGGVDCKGRGLQILGKLSLLHFVSVLTLGYVVISCFNILTLFQIYKDIAESSAEWSIILLD